MSKTGDFYAKLEGMLTIDLGRKPTQKELDKEVKRVTGSVLEKFLDTMDLITAAGIQAIKDGNIQRDAIDHALLATAWVKAENLMFHDMGGCKGHDKRRKKRK